VARGGIAALEGLAVVAIQATLDPRFDVSDPQTVLTPCVEITPVVNPLFEAMMSTLGARRLGARTFALGCGAKADKRALEVLFTLLRENLCYVSEEQATTLDTKGLAVAAYYRNREVAAELGRHAGTRGMHPNTSQSDFCGMPLAAPYAHQGVLLSSNGKELFIKVLTIGSFDTLSKKQTLSFYDHAPDLNLFHASKSEGEPVLVTPDVALACLESAAEREWTVIADPAVKALYCRLQTMKIVRRVPGSPGLAQVVIGAEVTPSRDFDQQRGTFRVKEMTCAAALRLRTDADETVIDWQVRDIADMCAAKPIGRKRLREHQDEFVSLYLATTVGAVNACAVGLGKTVMTLVSWREKYSKITDWKGIVSCRATLRDQWAGECERWFPEACLVFVDHKMSAEAFKEALADAKGRPVVCLVSYGTVRDSLEILQKVRFDDFCCDEAAFLSNTASQRSQAHWQLRLTCTTAVALTGTPIEKSVDDLGKIVAWTRGDRELFDGRKLSRRYDITDHIQLDELWKALGPTVFRRDRSAIAAELPGITTEVVLLDPAPAEKALAEGARRGLRHIFDDLQERIEAAASLDPSDPALAIARDELRAARGAALGGITLARMAASDPAAVAASDSAGRALLDSAGLITPAVRVGGTKRRLIAEVVSDLAKNGEAILIFTDFVTVADNLLGDLQRLGVRADVFKGGMSDSRRNAAVRAYQGAPCIRHREDGREEACHECHHPNLDCLVLTSVAREGLNLQRTTTLIHFDMPWVPSQVVQRVGRAIRIGSTATSVNMLIPVMRGTIEERVAAVLAPRAAAAIAVLDVHRGIAAENTEMGMSLAGLAGVVSEQELAECADLPLFDLARSLLS
jgi:hypothetical protein